MSWRLGVVLGSAAFFLISFPNDLAGIRESLAGPDHRLALGLSLKTLMAVLAMLGLGLDRTFGYAFLLGITLQSLLIRLGDLLGLAPSLTFSGPEGYLGPLVVPVAEILFRLNCLAFLFVYRKRLVGRR